VSHLNHTVELLAYSHWDNARLHHYAKHVGDNEERSMMPIAAFIYEYFMYNSLYSINWNESLRTNDIKYYRNGKEKEQQEAFDKYIRSLCTGKEMLFIEEFKPILRLDFSGSWIQVIPDTRVSGKRGIDYFNNIKELQGLVSRARNGEGYVFDNIFDLIKRCREYVYLVRCNIFHGSKQINDIDENHKKRIDVYFMFLKCFLYGFFKVSDNGRTLT